MPFNWRYYCCCADEITAEEDMPPDDRTHLLVDPVSTSSSLVRVDNFQQPYYSRLYNAGGDGPGIHFDPYLEIYQSSPSRDIDIAVSEGQHDFSDSYNSYYDSSDSFDSSSYLENCGSTPSREIHNGGGSRNNFDLFKYLENCQFSLPRDINYKGAKGPHHHSPPSNDVDDSESSTSDEIHYEEGPRINLEFSKFLENFKINPPRDRYAIEDEPGDSRCEIFKHDNSSSQYSTSLPKKTDEQTLLNKILQETASNVIDITSLGPSNLEQNEYLEKRNFYALKLSQVSSGAWPNGEVSSCLLLDVPNVEKILSDLPIPDEDYIFIKTVSKKCNEAILEISVTHTTDLVVPFMIGSKAYQH